MSPFGSTRIEETAGTCSGDARIANTRIPIWLLVLHRKAGQDDQQVLTSYPTLTPADLDAAWAFYRDNALEIEQSIWLNDTAANIPDGSPVPAAVIVAGQLLGLEDNAIREAFDPPLSAEDLSAAWEEYRANPQRVGRDIALVR
jgi:uncharacterized protein (DUF433 family)